MCIHIILPPTTEHIAEAQWDLIDVLDQALNDGWQHDDALHSLRGTLRVARVQTDSPQQWANAFAQAQACLAAGCQGIYYYNYGLLPPDRLTWVARANREVGGR